MQVKDLFDLSGEKAIVTGAAQGLGEQMALALAEAGADVAVVDMKIEGADKEAESFRNLARDSISIKADVTKVSDVENMVKITEERFGKIDILINNVGYHISKNIEETSEWEWDFIINTNLKSFFLCSKYAIPHLKKTKGCIINMSSMVGLVGQSNAGAYSATKGGIIAMTKGMALDFAKDGIRVNCICPGWIMTPLVDDWFSQQPDEQKAREYINSVHPLGRIGTIEECGRVALFLATEDSSFMTGSIMTVDGGVTLGY